MAHDEKGREVPDPRPVEWPLYMSRPLSIQDEIKRFIRIQASQAAQDAGEESFEEADDFDVGDDPDIMGKTEYELDDSQEGPLPFVKEHSGPQGGAGSTGSGGPQLPPAKPGLNTPAQAGGGGVAGGAASPPAGVPGGVGGGGATPAPGAPGGGA